MYVVVKQKYFNRDLSAVDIPFHHVHWNDSNSFRKFKDFRFVKLQIFYSEGSDATSSKAHLWQCGSTGTKIIWGQLTVKANIRGV